MLQLSICGRKKKRSHGKKLWVETKAHKCISLVTAGGMFAIKLSSVSEQTQSGSVAPSNAQLSQWFLVQFCLDPTENVIYAQKKADVEWQESTQANCPKIALQLMFRNFP